MILNDTRRKNACLTYLGSNARRWKKDFRRDSNRGSNKDGKRASSKVYSDRLSSNSRRASELRAESCCPSSGLWMMLKNWTDLLANSDPPRRSMMRGAYFENE